MWLYVPNPTTNQNPSPSPASAPASACSTSDSMPPSSWSEDCPSLSCTSSGKPTPRPSSWPGWRKRPWVRLLSGTTSRHSQAQSSVEQWLAALPSQASPARATASRAGASSSTTPATSGPGCGSTFATWDASGSSWRTSTASSPRKGAGASPPASPGFSETWPKTGGMRNGRCFLRPQWEPPTDETGSSSSPARAAEWSTPQAHDAIGRRSQRATMADRHYFPHDLTSQSTQWPPNRDAPSSPPGEPSPSPSSAASSPGTGQTPADEIEYLLSCVAGETGRLLRLWTPPSCPAENERFAAWMMGWPPGWADALTPCGQSETGSYLSLLRLRLSFFTAGLLDGGIERRKE